MIIQAVLLIGPDVCRSDVVKYILIITKSITLTKKESDDIWWFPLIKECGSYSGIEWINGVKSNVWRSTHPPIFTEEEILTELRSIKKDEMRTIFPFHKNL